MQIWRQINELGPIDRSDLHLEAFKDLLEDQRQEMNRQLESFREKFPDFEIPDIKKLDYDEHSPVSLFDRFTCESCGRTMIIPIGTRLRHEVVQALEREKANHRKECAGPPRESRDG